jgi:hypothetical protein
VVPGEVHRDLALPAAHDGEYVEVGALGLAVVEAPQRGEGHCLDGRERSAWRLVGLLPDRGHVSIFHYVASIHDDARPARLRLTWSVDNSS